MVILNFDTLGALFFDRQNITNLLNLFNEFYSDQYLSKPEKNDWFFGYRKYFIEKYVKILIKSADETTVKIIV